MVYWYLMCLAYGEVSIQLILSQSEPLIIFAPTISFGSIVISHVFTGTLPCCLISIMLSEECTIM